MRLLAFWDGKRLLTWNKDQDRVGLLVFAHLDETSVFRINPVGHRDVAVKSLGMTGRQVD